MPTSPSPAPLLPADDGLWLKTLRAEVSPEVFKEGRSYAENRRVARLNRVGSTVTARVVDLTNQKCEVELKPGSGRVESTCTCDQWGKPGPHCKHVVAVGLVYLARIKREAREAAEQEAALQAEALPDGEATGEAEDDPPPVTAPSLPGLAKVESWLGLSSQPDLEFLYRLTPARTTATARQWLLDVRRTDAQAKGPIHVRRMLATGARLAPQDERIFLELAKRETRFDARLLVSDEELAELFELLKTRKVIYRGTALTFVEAPANLEIKLESQTDGAVARLSLILPDDSSVALPDAILMVGRKSFLLLGQCVYRVKPDYPPRLLRKWLLEPTMSFPAQQLDRVLTFFAAHLPRFEMSLKADGIDVEEGVTPKFVLTLEGGQEQVKARLAARYGRAVVAVSPVAVHLGYASASSGGDDDGNSPRTLYRRDERLEREAGKALVQLGFRYDPSSLVYEALGDAALMFWADGRQALPPEWEILTAQAPKVRIRARVRPRIKVTMGSAQWFELDAQFQSEDQTLDLGAIRMWLESGRRFVPLKDGSFAEADPHELKRAADLLEEAGALPGKAKSRLPLFQASALELLSEVGGAEFEQKAREAIRSFRGTGEIPTVEAPTGLAGELRHYQQDGLSWLWFLDRHGLSGILADDMGLGKTMQGLSLIQQSRNQDGSQPSLVVAPTSVIANWEREAERFTPGLKVVVWHGQDRKERAADLKGSDLVLTSYALVRRDAAELSEVEFRYVILDEAQNIKNADSATAQACKALKSDHRLALTGTPLENRLSELWSIFDFLMPGFLGSPSSFADRYEHPIQVQGDTEVRDRLRKRIRPFILRRLKTEVAKELPPKTESVAYCEMEPGQAELYREVLEQSRRKVYDTINKVGFNRSRVSILSALMRLRQVCCDPRLLKLPPGTPLPPSAKLERFDDLVTDLVAEKHRALVFSQFTGMLELLKETAEAKGLSYLYLDGRTKDRMAKVDEFNDPAGPPLFFISLKAGGTGLNLTAADYVIHFDPWWNPAVEDQATDRTHRIGQTKAVISYKLITKGTVEEKILALQNRKRELAAGVLGGDTGMAGTLTESDVEELFRID